MEILKNYEKEVLNLSVADVLSLEQIDTIVRDGKLVGYEYTGSGYFLGIYHSLLPNERIVCDKPIVVGKANGITCGFIVFIENSQLTIECHSWGQINVPEEFRDKDVQVIATNFEAGTFVDLKSLF